MGAILAHAINGLRIIAVDLWKRGSEFQKQLNIISLVLFIGIFIPSTYKMTTSISTFVLKKANQGQP